MHTSRLAFNPALDTRRLAILIGAGILAVAAATAGRTYMDVQSNAADRVVELSAAFKAAPDLATLKGNSDLVIVGRIASQGTTRLVTQSGNSGITAPAPAALNLDPKKADAQKLQPAAPGVTPGKPIGNANIGTPVTTYSVQIERAVKGKGPTQISLTQLGGKVTLDTYPGGPKLQRTVEFEGDTLMQPGERNVLFLNRAADGTFFVASGPQGRLSVDKTGNVHPIDASAPALRAHEGKSLEGFLTEVESTR